MQAFFMALFFIVEMLTDSIKRRPRAVHRRVGRNTAPQD